MAHEIIIRVRNFDTSVEPTHGTIEVVEDEHKIHIELIDRLQEPYIFDPAFWAILKDEFNQMEHTFSS